MTRSAPFRLESRQWPIRRSTLPGLSSLALCWALLPAQAGLAADPASPKDWDFDIRAEKSQYAPGDTVKAFAGVVSRALGVQGWSYGVRHDTSVLDLDSVTTEGTDLPTIFKPDGFDMTTIVQEKGVKVGYVQAIILSFRSNVELPISEYFRMAAATYKVKGDTCSGAPAEVPAKMEFTEDIGVQPDRPVELNLTIAGLGVVPEKVDGETVKILCDEPAAGELVLSFDKSDTTLVADKTQIYDLKVLLSSTGDATFDVQGWSYGVQIDTNELVATGGEPGADAKALKGGNGPDFVNYELDDRDASGTVRGVSVGVIFDLGGPGTTVLPVTSGNSRHIDTIHLKSAQEIAEGSPSRTTECKFVGILGDDRPVEILIVASNEPFEPDSTDKLEIELLPKGGPIEKPKFIRGDANNDATVDVADGVWIINALFYGKKQTECKAAADANGDSKNDIADAMYIFQWQLQPGATPGNLFPKPPMPFPECGSVDGVEFADCPDGSTTCM